MDDVRNIRNIGGVVETIRFTHLHNQVNLDIMVWDTYIYYISN